MNILLISPHSSPKENETRYVSPALGVHRIAAHLNACGHYAEAFDPNLHDLAGAGMALEDKLRERVWDFIGVSCLEETLAQDMANLWTASRIVPSAALVAGGIEAQYNYQTILDKTPCEIVVLGEGEWPMSQICDEEGIPMEDIDGIVFKRKAYALNESYFTDATKAIDWEDIDYESYWDYYLAKYGDPTEEQLDQIHTVRVYSRNRCPFKCKFCTSTNHLPDACGESVKPFGMVAEDLVDVIERIITAHPRTRTIYLTSDDFCMRSEDVFAFCEEVIVRGLHERVSFMCFARAADLDAHMLLAMDRANFRRLNIGAESFSDSVLAEVGKSCTAGQIHEALEMVTSAGLQAFVTAMLVTPESTIADVQATLDGIRRWIDDPAVTFGLAPEVRPTKGSAFYEMYTDFETEVIPVERKVIKKHTRLYARDPAVKAAQVHYHEREAAYLREYVQRMKIKHGTYSNVAAAQVYLMQLCIDWANPKD